MNTSPLGILQHEQQLHDERAHRDILDLSPERRITHMALHFAKYAGRLIGMPVLDLQDLRAIVVDSTIICAASANTLGFSLEQRLVGRSADTLNELAEGYQNLPPFALAALPMWAGSQMARHNAKIAKACEAFDHREEYPYEQVLTAGVVEILTVCLATAGAIQLDLNNAIKSRWAKIERNYLARAA
jgi:hypothetical protein